MGRLADGLTIFVPFTAAGDVVSVRILERRPRFARGEVVEIEKPSPDRVVPPCAVFGRCGGCDWQHIAYPAQASAKRALLRDALERIGRLSIPDDFSFHASPKPYAYRTRARVVALGGEVGFRLRSSHDLCAVDACPVLAPELSAALPGAASLNGEVELARSADGSVRVHVLGDPRDESAAPHGVELAVAGDLLRVSPGVFAQANGSLLELLQARVLERAGRGGVVAELFAGAGLFTLGLSRAFERVVAVEVDAHATLDLAFNLERAGRSNVEIFTRSVDRALRRLAEAKPEVVVLDPPRSGLDRGVAAELSSIGARRLVYLSCDAPTLGRDALDFAAAGYRLTALEGFDLFPQTAHIEALAVLDRSDG